MLRFIYKEHMTLNNLDDFLKGLKEKALVEFEQSMSRLLNGLCQVANKSERPSQQLMMSLPQWRDLFTVAIWLQLCLLWLKSTSEIKCSLARVIFSQTNTQSVFPSTQYWLAGQSSTWPDRNADSSLVQDDLWSRAHTSSVKHNTLMLWW